MRKSNSPHVHDCACGCGRPVFLVHQKYASPVCRNRHHNRAGHRDYAGSLAGVPVVAEGLLQKLIDEETVLHPDEEEQLAASLKQAKREIHLRRGGADRALQLALDRGEVSS